MISISNLTFSYSNSEKNVFKGISTRLESGRIYGLMGCNGAGKTTLLYLLTGLLHPQRGKVFIDGEQPIRRLPQTLESIYLVPEATEGPQRTLENCAKQLAGFYSQFSHDVLADCLNAFELSADRRFDRLSTGEKKKAEVCLALATRAPWLFMDEPTNGLDIPSKKTFRKLVAQHVGETQTLILSTHLVHDVSQLIDHVLVLHHGGQLFDQSTAELTNRFAFQELPIDAADNPDVLYSEPSSGGRRAILSQSATPTDATDIDFELLFNAIQQGAIK